MTDDPLAHWYKAQPLHYGLQPSENKDVAAKRLLDALHQGSLEVPAYLRQLEMELKKEWDADERRMKRKFAAAASKQKKRKVNEDDDIAAAIAAATAAGLKGISVSNVEVNITVNIEGGEQ